MMIDDDDRHVVLIQWGDDDDGKLIANDDDDNDDNNNDNDDNDNDDGRLTMTIDDYDENDITKNNMRTLTTCWPWLFSIGYDFMGLWWNATHFQMLSENLYFWTASK